MGDYPKNDHYERFCSGADTALDVCFDDQLDHDRCRGFWQLTEKAHTHWRGTLGWFFQCHYKDLYKLAEKYGMNWEDLGTLFVLTVNDGAECYRNYTKYASEPVKRINIGSLNS